MTSNGQRRYWRSPAEAAAGPGPAPSEWEAWKEEVPLEVRRRSFLKAVGFGLAGAAVAGCEKAPVTKALPLLQQLPGVLPGRPAFYATTCGGCAAGCGMLARCRDGRPIKLEGMPEHPLSRGGLCAVGQASLLGLYDSQRFRQPQQKGSDCGWAELDQAIGQRLDQVRQANQAVRVLSRTQNSPTLRASLDRFLASFPDGRWVMYDPRSSAAIAEAHRQTHGIPVIPAYHFERAEVVVSLDADFLGAWISPVEFTAQRSAKLRLDESAPSMGYHAQFESCLSLTGSNADERWPTAPQEFAALAAQLAAEIARERGVPAPLNAPASGFDSAVVQAVAQRLVEAAGKSLIVCGLQDVALQTLCNWMNHTLGNYGTTLDVQQPSQQRLGSDADLVQLIGELNEGRVGALLVVDCNPLFELPESLGLAAALKQAGTLIVAGLRNDETSQQAEFICPLPHFLETWSDCEPQRGLYSIGQPLLRPLFNTRPLLESLAAWSGQPLSDRQAIERHWAEAVHPQAGSGTAFQDFFERAIHDGWVRFERPQPAGEFNAAAGGELPTAAGGDGFRLAIYEKVGILDGRHAYNPWLQELPDPVSKVTWDNYASLSVAAAEALGVTQGDVVRLEVAGAGQVELPVCIQPGQHRHVVAVAAGYGSVLSERFKGIGPPWFDRRPTVGANGRVGSNVAQFVRLEQGLLQYSGAAVQVSKTGRRHELASTQTHHTITVPEGLAAAEQRRRPIVQEATLEAYQHDRGAGAIHAHHFGEAALYPDDHPEPGHRWAMAIDLSACTGCSACVVACQAENNIPVVGKDEVRRRREMHWMRIDRYYSGDGDDVDVVHQPMLCQHCSNASCENVCPVLATVHTAEGLNAQVYNRCVGTRYCANNCAYKVRRFNWFFYDRPDEVQNLALNPDVTVRSRGIMEKCSFCVQRIQEAKIDAKRRGTAPSDDALQTACQQSCPAGAIVFGDIHAAESRVTRKLRDNARAFRVLEELDVQPSVHYLTLVRNRAGGIETGNQHHG